MNVIRRLLANCSAESAAALRIWIMDGPIFGRKTDAPKPRVGLREFEGDIKFSGPGRRGYLDLAVTLGPRPDIEHANRLSLFRRDAHLYERPMGIQDTRMSLFLEGILVRQFSFDEHANLEIQPLAASSACGGFHVSDPSGIRVPASGDLFRIYNMSAIHPAENGRGLGREKQKYYKGPK